MAHKKFSKEQFSNLQLGFNLLMYINNAQNRKFLGDLMGYTLWWSYISKFDTNLMNIRSCLITANTSICNIV